MNPPIENLLDDALRQSGLDPATREVVVRSCLNAFRHAASWLPPGNWSDAEWAREQQQVGCAEAWRAATEYNIGIALGAFIYEHVLSRLRTRYRQEWAYCLPLASNARSEVESGDSWPDAESGLEGFSPFPDPAQLAEQDEARAALEALPERYGSLLVHVFLEGETGAEVARRCCVTRRAINRRKSLGLKRLRSWYSAGDGRKCARPV